MTPFDLTVEQTVVCILWAPFVLMALFYLLLRLMTGAR